MSSAKIPTLLGSLLLLLTIPAALWAESPTLTADEAVKQALQNDKGIQSAAAAAQSSVEQAVAARLKMLPSLSLSAGYTKLSKVAQQTIDLPVMGQTVSIPFPSPPTNSYSLGASLRYPVFAGFRLEQAAKIADLKGMTKKATLEMMREAIAFEARRAYWQTIGAQAQVALLSKSLDVTKALVAEVKDEVNQGLATESDLLSIQQRQTQADIALSNGVAAEEQAYVALATLIGQDSVAQDFAAKSLAAATGDTTLPPPYRLTSSPGRLPQYPHTSPIDLSALLSTAMTNRGDLQAAGFGVSIAEHAKRAAEGGLYPTIAAIGDYTYANPNQRIFPTQKKFNGTWDVGVQLSFDIGGLPAAAAQTKAAADAVRQAQLQQGKQEKAVRLDVQKSAISLKSARYALDLARGTVGQANENLRVVKQKFDNGAAKHTDVLEAELSVLKAQFGVTQAEIGVQIAAADLARAVSMPLP